MLFPLAYTFSYLDVYDYTEYCDHPINKMLYVQMAEKFVLSVADTMQYVDIYFNPFVTNTSIYTFNLQVWNDAGGSPGIALYTGDTAENPAYGMYIHNQFIRYKLDAPLYLNPGTFYVGFTQNTNQFLNVGFDKNNNSQSKLFYNISGSWSPSPYVGSLMLHPVFGATSEFTGIADSQVEAKNKVLVYPNPAKKEITVEMADVRGQRAEGKYIVRIKNSLGQEIFSAPFSSGRVGDGLKINTAVFKKGICFVEICTADGKICHSEKIILQ